MAFSQEAVRAFSTGRAGQGAGPRDPVGSWTGWDEAVGFARLSPVDSVSRVWGVCLVYRRPLSRASPELLRQWDRETLSCLWSPAYTPHHRTLYNFPSIENHPCTQEFPRCDSCTGPQSSAVSFCPSRTPPRWRVQFSAHHTPSRCLEEEKAVGCAHAEGDPSTRKRSSSPPFLSHSIHSRLQNVIFCHSSRFSFVMVGAVGRCQLLDPHRSKSRACIHPMIGAEDIILKQDYYFIENTQDMSCSKITPNIAAWKINFDSITISKHNVASSSLCGSLRHDLIILSFVTTIKLKTERPLSRLLSK